MKIRKTGVFKKWLQKLRDNAARGLILTRIDRLEEGNPGDSRFLGDISEMRINYGPGYRVYFKDTGKEIIILLCGGDKSTQQADIARARQIALLPLEEENEEAENGKDNRK
jgi:putative addiction module killer protein